MSLIQTCPILNSTTSIQIEYHHSNMTKGVVIKILLPRNGKKPKELKRLLGEKSGTVLHIFKFAQSGIIIKTDFLHIYLFF